MERQNYLNLPAPASFRNKFIYRIDSIEHLFELFASKRNVLVKPRKWEDPFENFILGCRVQLPDGTEATFDFQDQFYGQCWTLQRASDAMWRIYSPKSDAVRIRSTVQKLADSLWQYSANSARNEVFIGRVQYLTHRKLEKFAKGVLQSAGGQLSMSLFAGTLLVKRPAFRHEREVRLVFTPHDKAKAKSDLFSYPVDPNRLIDQIMIDPRMALKDAASLKEKIRSKTGFVGEIKRSLLYAPPPKWLIPL